MLSACQKTGAFSALRDVLGIPARVEDEMLVETWVELMLTALAGSQSAD